MTTSKGKAHLLRVRADLATMPTNNVQARVIVGFCDDGGVPRHKNRLFIVGARVGRQVKVGGQNQDRSLLHPDCDSWNWQPGAKKGTSWINEIAGYPSIQIRLQHIDIEEAYDVGCVAFRGFADDPKPPGKSPFCKSGDMITAIRWDGNAFGSLPCAGADCDYRQPCQDARGNKVVLAKTRFTLIGKVDEQGTPPLLVQLSTGSDYNLAQFIGLIEKTEAQWDALCRPPQLPPEQHLNVPLSWYGVPILVTVYESTGDNSRFPRLHYTLACDLEELFQRTVDFMRRMSGYGQQMRLAGGLEPLALPASTLAAESESLDAEEVLNPEFDPIASKEQSGQARFRAAIVLEPTAPPAVQVPAEEVPPQQDTPPAEDPAATTPTLLERCQSLTKPSDLMPLFNEADAARDAHAMLTLLEWSARWIESLPAEKRPDTLKRSADRWSPVALWLEEADIDAARALLPRVGVHQPAVEPIATDDPFTQAPAPTEPTPPAPEADPVQSLLDALKAIQPGELEQFKALETRFKALTMAQKRQVSVEMTAAGSRAKEQVA